MVNKLTKIYSRTVKKIQHVTSYHQTIMNSLYSMSLPKSQMAQAHSAWASPVRFPSRRVLLRRVVIKHVIQKVYLRIGLNQIEDYCEKYYENVLYLTSIVDSISNTCENADDE